MTHKVHPKVFRIGQATDWKSRWFNFKGYKEWLKEDFAIRNFLLKKLRKLSVDSTEIEMSPNLINIIINTSRPGLLIGRGGSGSEEIKKQIKKLLKINDKDKKEVRIEIREVKNPSASAALIGQEIAVKIEGRMPFRRVIKDAVKKIMESREAKGAKVKVSGRLDGSEIARTEFLKQGAMPLQTMRAVVDYAEERALCTYGTVGIKVWIYKGGK